MVMKHDSKENNDLIINMGEHNIPNWRNFVIWLIKNNGWIKL